MNNPTQLRNAEFVGCAYNLYAERESDSKQRLIAKVETLEQTAEVIRRFEFGKGYDLVARECVTGRAYIWDVSGNCWNPMA